MTFNGNVIKLSFTSFMLEAEDVCSYDSLSVYDGNSRTDSLLAKLCGINLPYPVYSTTNEMLVVFSSDESVESGGFEAYFTFIGNTSVPEMVPCYPPADSHIVLQNETDTNNNTPYTVPNGNTAILECNEGYFSNGNVIRQCYNGTFYPLLECIRCDQTFTASPSIFSSPGFPNWYEANLLCTFRAIAFNRNVIKVSFTSFMLQAEDVCGFDSLSVYDGNSRTDSLLAKLCGTNLPYPVYSTTNEMLVVFSSDGSVERNGFEANFTFIGNTSVPLMGHCYPPADSHFVLENETDTNNSTPFTVPNGNTAILECNEEYFPNENFIRQCYNGTFYPLLECMGCNETFTASPSIFSSPGFPNWYEANLLCTFRAIAFNENVIKLSFTSFMLQAEDVCGFDSLSVYDGNSTTDSLLAKLCGTNLPYPVYSTTNEMFVVFSSDETVERNGFEANFTFIGNASVPVMVPCYPPADAHFVLDNETASNNNKTYTVPHSNTAILECNEGYSPNGSFIRQCYNGTFYPFLECIDLTTEDQVTTLLSQSTQYFIPTTSVTDYGCNETFTASPSTFYSPGFPNWYEANLLCTFRAMTFNGNVIKLSFTSFMLQAEDLCGSDSLSVYDGNSTTDSLLAKLCGTNLPYPVYSTTNEMFVVFSSDGTVERNGFEANFTFIGNASVPVMVPCYPPADAHFVLDNETASNNNKTYTVPHSNTAILECNEGYSPNGSFIRQCYNGTFYPLLECIALITTTSADTTLDTTTSMGTTLMDKTTLSDATSMDTALSTSIVTSTGITTQGRTTTMKTATQRTPTELTTSPVESTSGSSSPPLPPPVYQRRYVIPHLGSGRDILKYNFGFMDTDLSNKTVVRIHPSSGETFFGGIVHTFQHGLPKKFEGTWERSTIEVESTGDINLYFSLPYSGDKFFSYPINWLGTDYIVTTSWSSHNTSILITALSIDTKVSIFFSHEFVWEGQTYNFEKDFRRTFSELQSIFFETPFDPSGTYVKASEPVAVVMQLQSADNANTNNNRETSSSTYFLPPISSWGTKYWFSSSPNELFNFRVTAAYNGSSVKVTTIPKICGEGGSEFQLNAWQTQDFNNYINCSIEISSDLPILVIKTEYLNNGVDNVMVVPSKTNAVKGIVGIPLFVSAGNISDNLRIWVSDGDYDMLQVDGGKNNTWNVIGEESSNGVFVETELQPGYHVVSTTNDNSQLLITVEKKYYAAHRKIKGIQVCPFDRIYYSGIELTFRATIPRTSAQSIEVCGRDSSNANMSLARRNCGEEFWDEPELIECYSSDEITDAIEKISQENVTEENVKEVSNELALLTSQTEDLSPTDVDNAAESLESIVETGSPSPDVTDSVVGTVNNLMEVPEDTLAQAADTSSYVASLEKQVTNVHQNPDNFTEVQNNVGVKAVKLNPNVTKAITFINLSPFDLNKAERLSANLSDENTVLFNDEEEVKNENSSSSIYIPPKILQVANEAYQGKEDLPFSFLIYKNAKMFPANNSDDVNDGTTTIGEEIVSQVIAAKVEIENITIENLASEDAIITRFITTIEANGSEIVSRTCVFWKVSEDDGSKGFWSTEGCSLMSDQDDENRTACKCNHLTSFAVLFRIGKKDYQPKAYLDVITKVGTSLSVVGLTACILTLTLIKRIRVKQATKIHINLCLCLIGFYISFLAGDLAKGNKTHCKNIASAIHFFCLAMIAWMCAEAVCMYFMFVKYARTSIKYFIPVSFILCYGLPLIPTFLVRFLDKTELKDYCFLHPGPSLYYGFLLEILVMVIFNMIVFVLIVRQVVFRKMLSTNAQRNKKKEIIARIQQFVLFWIFLGLSWIFGFLSAIPKIGEIFTVLFCIIISLQGFILFIFICVKNPEIQKILVKTKMRFTSTQDNQRNLQSSSSLSQSRTKTDPIIPGRGRQDRNVNGMQSEDIKLSASQPLVYNPAFTPNPYESDTDGQINYGSMSDTKLATDEW
ncbi:Tolloid-like protein 2 [Holothuria leucospilota]|uniref:Tolloid-like protein 2 n=1 Tax=Holothuria leucospilota TaxID=206669 RepID=A0A9Q0YGR6_HOLLE|nr:Tolloid-like protein 2 [Holothuria leucospilota]